MKRGLACVLLASVVARADPPVCGDHVVDPGETCDDGNQASGDGCDATCQREPACGDGTVDRGEACDDGNRSNGDGCDDHCQDERAAVCGNGVKEAEEACDDGNRLDGDSCDSTCHLERGCCCGNGWLDPGEACDDGNDVDGDGCSTGCKIDPMWRRQTVPTLRAGNGFPHGTGEPVRAHADVARHGKTTRVDHPHGINSAAHSRTARLAN